MATGPWDQMAAGTPGHGHLRASDDDREQVIDALKEAFVQGRLTFDEFGTRAGQALASRTYAELAAITADIHIGLIEAPPPPDRARVPVRKPVNKKAVALAACMIIVLPVLGAAFLTFYGGFIVLFLFAFIGATVTTAP